MKKGKINSFVEYHQKLQLYNQFFGFFEEDSEDTSISEYSMFALLTDDYLNKEETEELRQLLGNLEQRVRRDLKQFIDTNR